MQGFDAGGALTLKPGWSVDSKNFSIRPAVKAGGLIFVAGQIGLNPDGSMPEKPEQQFVNAFKHLDIAGLARPGLIIEIKAVAVARSWT